MNQEEMLTIIKLRIKDKSKDSLIEYYIKAAKQRIMNDCWRDDYPEELDHVVIEMVVGKMNGSAVPGITSIKRGDTSMSYDSSDAFHRVMERYSDELSRFRRVIVG